MSDYDRKDYLTKRLDSGFNNLYKKLTEHFDKQFDEVREDIAELNKKYDHLINTLDAFLKRLDNIEANDAARNVQLARHERWLEQIAAKTGVKLQY
jgi:septal ring factor EnvC (AmiA/AmiB activator)